VKKFPAGEGKLGEVYKRLLSALLSDGVVWRSNTLFISIKACVLGAVVVLPTTNNLEFVRTNIVAIENVPPPLAAGRTVDAVVVGDHAIG
jgi:hypothetical protein